MIDRVQVMWYGTKGTLDQQYLMDMLMKDSKFQFVDKITDKGGIIFVVKYNWDKGGGYDEINAQLRNMDWAIVMFVSDEERKFKYNKLACKNISYWLAYAKPMDKDERITKRIGCLPGYKCLEHAKYQTENKTRDWFFAGQTREHRKKFLDYAQSLNSDKVFISKGFNQGLLNMEEYFEMASSCKIMPCPSGPQSADTFRLFEALECGAIPIAEEKSIMDPDGFNYWKRLFDTDKLPFPTVTDWKDLQKIIAQFDNELNYYKTSSECMAFWINEKVKLKKDLIKDIERMSYENFSEREMTALITTSYIPSHPSTDIIEEVIKSVRDRSDCEIIISVDQIRPEQKEHELDYWKYVKNLCTLVNAKYLKVRIVISPEWEHQANATKRCLKLVETPLVLFLEHDTPLVGEIPFKDLCKTIQTTEGINSVRFHYHYKIHPEHEYLMKHTESYWDFELINSRQWSQRPHLARTTWYRYVLDKYFPETCRTLIEDKFYSVVEEYKNERGNYIFKPKGDIQRSGHSNGRQNNSKFEMKYT